MDAAEFHLPRVGVTVPRRDCVLQELHLQRAARLPARGMRIGPVSMPVGLHEWLSREGQQKFAAETQAWTDERRLHALIPRCYQVREENGRTGARRSCMKMAAAAGSLHTRLRSSKRSTENADLPG
ncbi:hypothetical protein WOLCODRAFT_155251 [Wolfiporia cocos MD-104 SS10]|uniref:Uncharacterized protein n=1 Tax=Wolfiporia cocos (strain MD-104) TaxID=742152 RepID=A0A2H3JD24_WOLCO|nr:hypothetical protein WOLCODRAFT_155251 [Wolfiporia cocos MD-104 SS10]